MTTILVPIIVVLAVLMVAIVLIQKSKGGGLAAGFQSSNQIMGAPKTADVLEKATWTIMGVIAILCILCTVTTHKGSAEQGSALQIMQSEAPMSAPENIDDVEASAAAAEAPVEEATAE